jgi:hypothetical protein
VAAGGIVAERETATDSACEPTNSTQGLIEQLPRPTKQVPPFRLAAGAVIVRGRLWTARCKVASCASSDRAIALLDHAAGLVAPLAAGRAPALVMASDMPSPRARAITPATTARLMPPVSLCTTAAATAKRQDRLNQSA